MERVSRRHLLAASSGAALVSAVVGSGVAAAQGTRPPGQPVIAQWLERYILVIDASQTKSARQASGSGVPTGPAYFTGSILRDEDQAVVGRFRYSGWVYGGGAAPQVVAVGSFDIAGRGKVSVAGASGPVGSVAVTGGTGDFTQVGGEARFATVTPGSFDRLILELDLRGQSTGR